TYGNAWLIKGFKKVQTSNEEMRALDNTSLRDTAVVHSEFNNQLSPSFTYDSTASITMIQRNNDTILYKSNAQSPQFAVFSEIYYNRGWNAYLDGKKVDYARVNYVLRGMTIPAGDHEIRFIFEPESYKTGKKISTWSTLLLYGLMLSCLILQIRGNSISVAGNESNPSKED
ncbi:MAG: YfhO family protein, partial [Ferruginibacter sp.]